MSANYVTRRYNIDCRHDEAIARMVDEMGGNVTPSYFVNLAFEAFFGDAVARVNGAGAHQHEMEQER